MYRRRPGRQPSAYLVSKLRQQEALQRRCGPGTVAYSNALEQLRSGCRSGGDIIASPECKYLVSISCRGLGNRILVDPSNEMDDLFCEPFADTTWLLPPGFPVTNYTSFGVDTAESYGNMVRNKVIWSGGGVAADASTTRLPAFAYVHPGPALGRGERGSRPRPKDPIGPSLGSTVLFSL